MGLERTYVAFPGLLTDGQTAGSDSVGYRRELLRVQMERGTGTPSGPISVKARLDGVEQSQTFTLPLATPRITVDVSGGSLEVDEDVAIDWIITANGGGIDLVLRPEYESAGDQGIVSTEDLGLGTLLELKKHLLNEGIVTESTYDTAIAQIGRGVAGLFDSYCTRAFARAASTTDEFPGDLLTLSVPRYPIESVASIELKTDEDTGFETQSNAILTINKKAGLINLNSLLGDYNSLIRVTYTGGYWYDTTVDGSGTKPAAATLLPHEIKLAWLQQCHQCWMVRDNLGISHTGEVSANAFLNTRLSTLDLLPQVKIILDKHRRLALL